MGRHHFRAFATDPATAQSLGTSATHDPQHFSTFGAPVLRRLATASARKEERKRVAKEAAQAERARVRKARKAAEKSAQESRGE